MAAATALTPAHTQDKFDFRWYFTNTKNEGALEQDLRSYIHAAIKGEDDEEEDHWHLLPKLRERLAWDMDFRASHSLGQQSALNVIDAMIREYMVSGGFDTVSYFYDTLWLTPKLSLTSLKLNMQSMPRVPCIERQLEYWLNSIVCFSELEGIHRTYDDEGNHDAPLVMTTLPASAELAKYPRGTRLTISQPGSIKYTTIRMIKIDRSVYEHLSSCPLSSRVSFIHRVIELPPPSSPSPPTIAVKPRKAKKAAASSAKSRRAAKPKTQVVYFLKIVA